VLRAFAQDMMNNDKLVMMLAPVLTPHGVLILRQSGDAVPLEPALASRLEKAFAKGPGYGLLCLGADEVGTVLPPVLSYWREFGSRYVTALCALPGIGEDRTKPPVPAPANSELEQIVLAVPPMAGAEYLTTALLGDLWYSIDTAFDAELAIAKLTVQEFLKGRHPAWNLVGRVHFNLAENRMTKRRRLHFWQPTRRDFQLKRRHSIYHLAKRYRSTPGQKTATVCYRFYCPSSARLNSVHG
jgi:non-specific serine/threonine protein kinase